MCQRVIVADESHEGAVHMQISTIGIDIAKNVFQVHGVDAAGKPVLKKQLRRGQMLEFFGKLPPCLIGMEACATSHHWARELKKLGHDVRLMPPSYVKAYVKRGKNDADTAVDALRADQKRRAAGRADAASDAGPPDPSAHAAHQRHARPSGRTRSCGPEGARGSAAADANRGGRRR